MLSLFQELKWRNLIKNCSDEENLEKVLNNEKINFYCGFDPTANSLTLGHLVQINTILLFSKNGHFPFILIGSGTGLIGDPKETKERMLISEEKIFKNSSSIKKQFQKIFFDQKIKFLDNYDWISKINFINFFRFYGKLFNVNYMISKDIVAQRLKKGISYTEFSYMILQSLDFYQLYQNFNIRLQFGGSDQWGNITSGLELIRKINFKKRYQKPFGFSIPLLLDEKGIKFGKSEKNTLWLNKDLTNSYKIYQYLLNINDDNVINYLKKLTLLVYEKIVFLEKETKINPKKRLAQKKLAKLVVSFLYGENEFKKCFKINQILFYQNIKSLSLENFMFLSQNLDCIKVNKKSILLVDALVQTKLAESKNEARRFIIANSIKVLDNYINEANFYLDLEKAFYNKYFLLIKKNKFHALVIFE
ncbi:tyrosine--tRNA ligase [Candidatus Phytoplasma oryzae]|uniref:Tyrosine--tRNA ligase n=1 Tax=Candidatus Phytoplasma oryzae TaxID=203274 RepID=A0A139JQ83_9MOLU|nr:tyrosine--tRNA ligase [Candidatus Phytoplasma oryzae]KXT29122.1 tyrosine--tRNA ligase [Candidatus Phytoplasma oryzae]RAM57560.1 tyrosyl-tRNA synthetase [Candidatus Phytoplasma oryzae]